MREKIVLLLAVLILVPISAHADIITNGNFEDNGPVADLAYATWTTYTAIPGWTADYGDIELRNHVAGAAYEGSMFVELDSYYNSAMSQTVTTDLDSLYTLSYWYAPRESVVEASNGIELWFNDTLLDSISGDGYSSSEWSLRSFTVTGTGSADIIRFLAVGRSDSYGGSIDKVSMELVPGGAPSPVPEPTSLILLGTGLAGIGLTVWRKRK